MRMCAVCRTSRPKRELIRVVRTLEGPVVIDPTGKRNGRGAYLCRQRTCWTAAFKRKTLDHALQTPVSAEDRATLEAYAQGLPETLPLPAPEAVATPGPSSSASRQSARPAGSSGARPSL